MRDFATLFFLLTLNKFVIVMIPTDKESPGSTLVFANRDEVKTFLTKLQNAMEWKKKNLQMGKNFSR